jgi:hypothetical protein
MNIEYFDQASSPPLYYLHPLPCPLLFTQFLVGFITLSSYIYIIYSIYICNNIYYIILFIILSLETLHPSCMLSFHPSALTDSPFRQSLFVPSCPVIILAIISDLNSTYEIKRAIFDFLSLVYFAQYYVHQFLHFPQMI